MSLTGRVALVTGGTGALGQAVTRRLLAEGATVAAPFIVDAERDRLQAGVDATAKDRLLLVRADVTDERAVGDLVNTLQARHRRLDVLVTLVGGFAGGGLLETDRATWDRRSEEHTSELQSLAYLVCRLLLEKKKKQSP